MIPALNRIDNLSRFPRPHARKEYSMSAAGYSEEETRNRRIAGLSWQRGTEAMSKENWDFAVEMFSQCVKLVPDNLTYRQTLRGVQYRKYKNNKTGASMAFMKVNSLRGKVKKAKSAKNWREMDRAAEEGLSVNPWDAQFNSDVGEACRELGFDEVAVYALQKAVESAPDSKEHLQRLGEMLEQKGDYAGAISCFEKIFKMDPLNGEARSRITQLRADSVIDRGGYDKAKTTRDVSPPKQGYEESVRGNASSNPNEVVGPGVSVEADLQRMIRKEPENVANYQKLGNFYQRENRLDDALKTYQQALEVSGGNVSIREQMEDIQLEMIKKNLDAAKSSAAKGDEQGRANAVRLAKELLDQELEIFGRRMDRYPADLRMKYEQAQRLMRVKKFQLAARLLQQASKDPRLEGPVLLNLGKCFLAEKQNALALRQFEKAVQKFDSNDDAEAFVECHYLVARLYEEAGDTAKSANSYSEILAVNYDYRDALARLQKIQEAGGG